LNGYINKSEQLFIDILKELEDDLNIIDDAYIVLVKEYYMDGNGKIKMHRIKEMYRGDPATMHIYADENGERGAEGDGGAFGYGGAAIRRTNTDINWSFGTGHEAARVWGNGWLGPNVQNAGGTNADAIQDNEDGIDTF